MKRFIVFTAIIISTFIASITPASAYNRYRERSTAIMTNEKITLDFVYIDTTAPMPERIELIAKNVFIGYGTPYATSDGFKLEMWRGCNNPLYPQFDYISSWSSYGYIESNQRFVFILPGSVRVEQYGDFPSLIRSPNGGYVGNANDLQTYCRLPTTPTPSGTLPPVVSGNGDSFLSPLFDMLADIINSILKTILGQ